MMSLRANSSQLCTPKRGGALDYLFIGLYKIPLLFVPFEGREV